MSTPRPTLCVHGLSGGGCPYCEVERLVQALLDVHPFEPDRIGQCRACSVLAKHLFTCEADRYGMPIPASAAPKRFEQLRAGMSEAARAESAALAARLRERFEGSREPVWSRFGRDLLWQRSVPLSVMAWLTVIFSIGFLVNVGFLLARLW